MKKRRTQPIPPWTDADSERFREVLQSYTVYTQVEPPNTEWIKNDAYRPERKRPVYPVTVYSIDGLDEETKRKYGLGE